MELDKKNTKKVILIVCSGIMFYIVLQHLGIVATAIKGIFSIIFPFILGGIIAFILNVPMRALEKLFFSKHKNNDKNKKQVKIKKQLKSQKSLKPGFKRPLCLVLTILLFLAVLTLAVFVIAPGIVDAVRSITAQLPAAFDRLEKLTVELEEYLPVLKESLESLDLNWKSISTKAAGIIKSFGTSLISASGGIIGSVVSGVGTFVIAFVFAIYILLQKEKLGNHVHQIIYAILPEEKADKFFEIVALSDKTFSNFLSGQCLEACILGSLFVICMTIFRMPYALLVGVLIAITALIPIIGAFIGCFVGALLIAITSPVQALVFVIMFLVLQQLEGNLIYPHVVGSSVGLPSIWVLAAVTLGGKLMGVAGILLFIPLCSVCYALFRGFIKKRLVSKNVPMEKINIHQCNVANEPDSNNKEENK